MRTGGCAVQQTLTPEAAGIVRQAVALAKRRGHAQVTPLHVANAMLEAPNGLLRAASSKSHPHPLQCKALELCFNVALNRLPSGGSSAGSPMLSHIHHSHYPSISNALVAALKRAQAHQRRGSTDQDQNQQQTILAVKIELEQLVISILDDPSVSRVMREAGFSSIQVKSNVEKVVSSDCPNPSFQNERKVSKPSTISEPVFNKNDDINVVIESLLSSRKRSLVMVGENVSNMESTVKELMGRVDRQEVPMELREVKFITIPPLYTFYNLQRHFVEQKMGELSCLVKSLVSRGVVLYLGDLNWISEYKGSLLEQEKGCYCSVEHMIMEIGRLVSGFNGEINGRFWVMGIANFETYMRCRNGYNSLQDVWGLHAVTIPANSLGFSLIFQSDEPNDNQARKRRVENGSLQLLLENGEVKLTCCPDCSSKFESEKSQMNLENSINYDSNDQPKLSNLPPWLKDESRRLCSNDNDQNCDSLNEIAKKWNSYCSSSHKQPRLVLEKTLTLSSASPSSSTSCFSFDPQDPSPQQNAFSSNKNLSSTPTSSENMDTGYVQKFKEFNSQTLNFLCNALEEKVPWQKEIIPEIAGTILQCRSGMSRRKDKIIGNNDVKEETWLFFLGPDAQAKEKISRRLARIVFGSCSNFLSIGVSSSFTSPTKSNSSSEDYPNKRGRDEQSCSNYIDRFAQAVSENPHRVFLLEDFEQADYFSQKGIKRAIERGRISINGSCEEVSFCDAIVILSCDGFRFRSRGCSPSKHNMGNVACVPLDLNISFDIDDGVVDQSLDNLGMVENVDRCVVFKVQKL